VTVANLEHLDPGQFERFRDLIYRKSGISVSQSKRTLLSNRIRRRLREGQGFDEYYRFLVSHRGQDEIARFIDAITTNETFFFRSAQHFEWLRTDFLGEMIASRRRGERPASLRVWSAGCATGAEPYSIAICLEENMYRLRDWTIDILGTDISEQALEAAREGVFKARAVEGVSDRQRSRFLDGPSPEGSWRVGEELRRFVRFEHHNLLTPMSRGPFDCVFIRNVLIYFDEASKRSVVRNLIDAMSPGAYLVVGPSEGVYDMLDPLERRSAYLYRKGTP